MSATVDTNILIYAANEADPQHERAVRLVEHLAGGRSLTILLWPTVLGFLRISTNATVFPKPLKYEEAVGMVDALVAQPNVRVVGEGEDFWDAYRLVADEVKPRGNLVIDAHLVALMQQHGVSTIWTRDRDFRKFDGITVKDPFAEKYAKGFD